MSTAAHTPRVIITAGAAGLGRALAGRFLASGATVHVCDVDPSALATTLAEHPGLRGAVADVSRPDSVERYFGQALSDLGGVDVLVNNAGIAGPRGGVEDIAMDAWDACIRTNLSGAYYCIRQVVPHLKRQGHGAIINISTASVRTGLPARAAYIAGKAGLEGLTRTLARELGPDGIRVNALQPGLLDNARARGIVSTLAQERGLSTEAMTERFLGFISLRCWIDPDEVADMAVFLASPAARHVTGQIIGVCGNVEWES